MMLGLTELLQTIIITFVGVRISNQQYVELFWNSSYEYGTVNWRNLTEKQVETLSKIGRILYVNEKIPQIIETAEQYKYLLWKPNAYTMQMNIPVNIWPVSNCMLTYNSEDLETVDLVLIYTDDITGVDDLPSVRNRHPSQIWVFVTQENPHRFFVQSKDKVRKYNGIFNWSMTYAMDSDVPMPYGGTIAINPDKSFNITKVFNEWRAKKQLGVLVAIMGSNCDKVKNNRWKYVRELQKIITVDVYGKCGTLKCPGRNVMCTALKKYVFYLAFENANCDEYITEKVWRNAYHSEAIPIVMGSPKASLKMYLPPNSYLSVEDFPSPKELANYLVYLNNSPSVLQTYIAWKERFIIVDEEIPSSHYIRICQALNYNNKTTKIYNNLESFWTKNSCYKAWDVGCILVLNNFILLVIICLHAFVHFK